MTIKLIGERITLRPPRKSDAQDICEGAHDVTVARNTFVPYPYALKDAHAFINNSRKLRKSGTSLGFGILENETGKLIGMIGLQGISKKHRRGEVGYWLNRKYRNNGYITEALNLVIAFCFKTLKFEKIEAGAFAHNPISSKILLKAGFKDEGLLRRQLKHRGRWCDMYRYGLLKSEHAGRDPR